MKCKLCNKDIPQKRIDILNKLGKKITCVSCSDEEKVVGVQVNITKENRTIDIVSIILKNQINMNKYVNYYGVLGINKNAEFKEIKKAYYTLSKEYHPDKQTGNSHNDNFVLLSEAYKILSDKDTKEEYDKISKFGNNYDEFTEIFDYEFGNNAKNYDKNKYEEFVKRDQLNILIYVDENFDGTIEYERQVPCKDCNGSGMNKNAKMNMGSTVTETHYFETEKEAEDFIQDDSIVGNPIVEIISSVSLILTLDKLRDAGNIDEDDYYEEKRKYEKQKDFIKVSVRKKPKQDVFDLSDECEFCEGSGKWGELDCFFCSGLGKINGSKCKTCNGEKRIIGKQKLSNINFPKDSKDFKIEHMGNYSRDIPGKTGHIWLIKKGD